MKTLTASLVVSAALVCTFATPAEAQNPFVIDGTVPDAGVPATADPHANSKELGPLNGSPTKIGVINTAVPPMLDMTNPNAQVDLATAYLATKKDLTSSDQWLYFGWTRDSNSGSGFISIEFQQSALSATCVYTGVDFSNKTDAETAALIASCNPWRNRQTGDFIIMWDQQGNTLDPQVDIKKRVFTCAGAPVSACTLGPNEDLGSVEAAVSTDRFSGEMAINLTEDVFSGTDGCQTFANTLPGTVTGNSDTADYKDTIFAIFPPITNCGVLTVSKRLLDPAGNPMSDASALFSYKVNRSGGGALRFASDAADHPLDGPAGVAQFQILRPNAATSAPAIKGGETHTHSDLIIGTDYQLVETALAASYELVSIICTDSAGEHNLTVSGTFRIDIPDTLQATACVITNRFVRTSPALTTAQSVKLNDSLSMLAIQPGAANRPTTVIFRLYSDNGCQNLVPGGQVTADLLYAADGKSATANTLASGGIGVSVSPGVSTTFYWRVAYAGDTFNFPVTTACGDETTTVNINK